MTRHILLHVGSPKCGSTYLQRCLIQSADALREAGLHYPHDGKGHPGNAAALADLDAPALEALFPADVHTTILSHEDLLFLPRRGAALARLAPEAGIAVCVLVFLRPFSEILYGSYSQHMKQHFERFLATRRAYDGQSFEDFCTARARQFAPLRGLRGWAETFGRDALTIAGHRDLRPVVEGLLPGAPIDWTLPHYLGNPSLRIADCAALARAIADPARDADDLRTEFKAIHHLTREPDPGRTPERTAWLESLMEEANAGILDAFGYDNRAAE
ncbi:hypothetical protein [Aestuariicoccus sp. MJ-SS9]|uniref:hypothetical protein n=1 Tax=Aestuariicoccus sp. MJ-SS9 TaxID=3079855 RepID=UPI002908E455|nr:hypothetical protein [Aestuariicoccus sp. MJ-SS9]MDU8912160.1 hypothetical protein [Aestuariicoccus sp. MJ-SS9]